MLKKLSALAALVTMLSVAGGFAYAHAGRVTPAGSDDDRFSAITVEAIFDTGDFPPKGEDNPGDVLTFHGRVVNVAQTRTLGRQDGFCVFTETENGLDHFEVCQLVFSLRGGQISLQGTFDQTVNPNRFAVVGGTGVYRDARGQVVADFSKEFLFHFELTA
jgi:hypothetical protein